MDYFSTEYLDKLVNEHKLVTVSLDLLRDRGRGSNYFARKTQENGRDAVHAAIMSLLSEKIVLEAKIDTLRDYLN